MIRRVRSTLVALCIFACAQGAAAHSAGTTPDPGFRPASPYADTFLQHVGDMTIDVLPTLVRREKRTAHSMSSQQSVIALLNAAGIGEARAKSRRVQLGPMRRPSQWELFQYGLESVAQVRSTYQSDADYTLAMELLVPGGQEVFGIEVYIIDSDGHNAFSFLLNSHHEMFQAAKLVAKNSSEEARGALIARATELGVEALQLQIARARVCAGELAARQVAVPPDVLHDFETPLYSATDANGTSLGFSAFTDGPSDAGIAISSAHPERPGQRAGNRVLQLDMDVTGWAGVVYIVPTVGGDQWGWQDWRGFDAFSFWLYGNNTGATIFVDIIDNRNPCSEGDDAERYVADFKDSFSGWKKITIRFADMRRKEIGNGAPDDGLGLDHVHGWGLGATNTGGPVTYYIDDFTLLRDAQR